MQSEPEPKPQDNAERRKLTVGFRWGKAGDLALRRSAFHEAIAHLGKVIEMADTLENLQIDPRSHVKVNVR